MNNHVSYGFLEILLKSWGSSSLFLCCVLCLVTQSCQTFFVTLWTVAHQAPLVGLEYWNGLPCPPPRDLSDPGIKPRSPPLQVNSLPSEPPWKPKNTGVGCNFLLQCMKVKWESEVAQSFPTLSDPWTAAYQAPLSMGFSRQEYWSGLPSPSSTQKKKKKPKNKKQTNKQKTDVKSLYNTSSPNYPC